MGRYGLACRSEPQLVVSAGPMAWPPEAFSHVADMWTLEVQYSLTTDQDLFGGSISPTHDWLPETSSPCRGFKVCSTLTRGVQDDEVVRGGHYCGTVGTKALHFPA